MRRRAILAAACAAALAAFAIWAVADLPAPNAPPKASARLSTSVAVHERHVTNTVAGVTFDLRGLDTLGEELILFAAAIGAGVLLRATREEGAEDEALEAADEQRAQTVGPVRSLGALLAAPLLVFGAYVVSHGTVTPGGGFQGGVILAAAFLLVFAAGQVVRTPAGGPVDVLELSHALGAAAYAVVVVGGLVFASAAGANFIALGISGQMLSGGTILVLEVAVGAEVAAALTLILAEFLDQALLRGAS